MTRPRIDLRSDTVTRPTAGMRKAMFDADVGDDVYGDDPTVDRLEAVAAERLGKSLFVPSGIWPTSSVGVACRPGEAALLHQDAHPYQWEAGAAAMFWGVTLRPLPGARGMLDPTTVAQKTSPAKTSMSHRSPLWGWRTPPTGEAVRCGPSRSSRPSPRSPTIAASPPTSTELGSSTPASPPAWTPPHAVRPTTASASASARGWALRWARCSWAARTGSTTLGGSGRHWGAGCAKLAFSQQRRSTPWTTMWTASPKTTVGDDPCHGLTALGFPTPVPDTNLVFVQTADAVAAEAELSGAGLACGTVSDTTLRLAVHLDLDDADIAETLRLFEALPRAARP